MQPYAWAVVYAGLRDRQRAFDWLEKGLALRSEELAFLRVDPAVDPLRSDPRFAGLSGEAGIGG